jgi:hypothetical protein
MSEREGPIRVVEVSGTRCAMGESFGAQTTALAEQEVGTLDTETLKSFFADTSGVHVAICRDDTEGTGTNAAAIFAPEKGSFLACHGLPSRAPWGELHV